MDNFIFCNEIDLDQLSLGEKNPKYLSGIPILYKDSELYLHTPKLKVPFRLFDRKTRTGKIFKKQLVMNLPMDTPDKHVIAFKEFLQKFDQRCLELSGLVEDPSTTWYKSTFTKKDLDGSEKTTFGVDVRVGYNDPNTIIVDAFDKEHNAIDVHDGTFAGHHVTCIVKFEGMWKSNDKMGMNWTVVQIRLCD
jgi:hypothetical protein